MLDVSATSILHSVVSIEVLGRTLVTESVGADATTAVGFRHIAKATGRARGQGVAAADDPDDPVPG
jgi:hypothetical protein